MNFQERSAKLKEDLHRTVNPLIQEFYNETGVVPSKLSVVGIDVTTVGDRTTKMILGAFQLEFKL